MANVTACGAAVVVEEELVGGVAPPEDGEDGPESQPWEDFEGETPSSSIGWCNPSLGVVAL